MEFVEKLMGGGQQQEAYQGFVNRYESGHPSEGYDEQEVMQRHQEVASQLSPEEYQQAAQQSFERMSPEERKRFGQHLQEEAQQQGYNDPTLANAGHEQFQDSGFLAQAAAKMQGQEPGMLGQLLGGGGGGLGGMLGGSSGSGMMGNPMAKAALAGIAAFAAKKMMNR
jgi:hypothetical protein